MVLYTYYVKLRRYKLNSTKEFIVTLLFGWLGVHKFMKKKYLLGFIYLFTLGIFFIGWIADVVIAFSKLPKHLPFSPLSVPVSSSRLIKSFDTVIVGTFAKCALDPYDKREDLIMCVKPNWKLSLKYFEYKGKPAYYVCHPNGSDLGCVRQGLAEILYNEYSDCIFNVIALDRVNDNAHDVLTYNIRINIIK